jgi:hypothetical protein
MSDIFQHTPQQRAVLLARQEARQERLARLDTQLRGLNELRECTDIPELRKLLDEKLDEIGTAREAINQ